jgi:RNA polymerase sigma factor (sigma-70 family)
MTSPPTDEWPTDADDLAAIARNSSPGEERHDRAVRDLEPTIRRVARRLVARFVGSSPADLLEEALGRVWEALGGYEPGNSFEAWCYGVLRNHLLARFRQQQRERAHRSDATVETQAVELQRALEKALDGETNLSEADLQVVRGWASGQRLAVLALCGLWRRVPGTEWSAWVEEYRTDHQSTLPDPFPPASLEECADLSERMTVLCDAVKVPRNTLSVWLYRRKPMLRELQYVRDLLDNP